MSIPEGRPALRRGCRLSSAGDLLLIPEGALRLQGPAAHILRYTDGTRTIAEIAAELQRDFPGADRAKMIEDTAAFLEQLAARAVVEFL